VAVELETSDLSPFVTDLDGAKAEILITDALALAVRVAPCLADETLSADVAAAAKAILRAAVLRWYEAGAGVSTQLQAGPFQSQQSTTSRRTQFYPNEIRDLAALCSSGVRKAYMVDMLPEDEEV
jgi:hypothetical protein